MPALTAAMAEHDEALQDYDDTVLTNARQADANDRAAVAAKNDETKQLEKRCYDAIKAWMSDN